MHRISPFNFNNLFGMLLIKYGTEIWGGNLSQPFRCDLCPEYLIHHNFKTVYLIKSLLCSLGIRKSN